MKINNKKIIFAVGNITDNKNQKQIIEAMHEYRLENAYLILFGNECDGGEVRRKITEYKLEDRVILAGFCNSLREYWQYADINALCSLNEGFGLSVIEAFSHGVPTVTFSDLDAVPDLFSEDSMLLAKSRSTESLAKAIGEALRKDWKREEIKKEALNFTMETTALKYIEVYKNLI